MNYKMPDGQPYSWSTPTPPLTPSQSRSATSSSVNTPLPVSQSSIIHDSPTLFVQAYLNTPHFLSGFELEDLGIDNLLHSYCIYEYSIFI
jgi:hypothetical protein